MPAITTGSQPGIEAQSATAAGVIRTPDQRLRVFVSSSMRELAEERRAVGKAVTQLRLVPVMFEMGARPHPARELYRAYLAQSQVFVGVYWQSYGWIAPGQQVSGIEDEYSLAAGLPRLIYVKSPAPGRDPRLTQLLDRIIHGGDVSFQQFTEARELERLVENDLAILLSERFEMTVARGEAAGAPPAGSLPAPATPLVDRQQDAAAVVGLIADQAARLVTLTGPGGVGKSRLAIEAAARLSPEFSGGVRFVDLSPVQSASLVPAAIAGRLGLSTSGDKLMADLTSYLRSRRLLLLIDNFEQVSGAAPLLSELLASAPGLTLLVTSRSVLRLRGEYEFAVSPLGFPPEDAAYEDVARLRQYPAVLLFAQRASAAAPGFELTDDNVSAVAEICRRLDGLPLAIELAGARIRLLPPRALLARLGDGLQVLASGARDLPERQRTIKNTLDWSYDLLSPGEQSLFARLGVFAGTFGLPAAQAVGAASDPPDPAESDLVIDGLGSLVDNSLVQAEPHGAEPRFRLLDTVREYALQRLRETADWTEAHDRHAAYFLALAEPAESELSGPGQLAWLERLEIRRDNLAAALSWLTSTGQLRKAVHMIWATWRFWWLHGHADELGQFTDAILASSEDMAAHDRALALSGSGFVTLAGGDATTAEQLFGESLPLYRQSEDPLGGALAAAALGHVLAARGDYRSATELLEQTRRQLDTPGTGALKGRKRVQYLLVLALTENFLGQIQLSDGQYDRAARHFARGLQAARDAPDRFTILVSLYDLALSTQAQGNLTGAAALLEEGKSLAADTGDKPSTAYYLEALAEVAGRQHDPQRASQLRTAAKSLLEAHGSGWLSAYVPRATHQNRSVTDHRKTGELPMPASKAAAPAAHVIRASLHQIRLSPPPLRTAEGHGLERRRASWVELFFDLVFAAAVNQLASTLQNHPDLATLARFAFFFIPVWWLWVQFTFYADRHESDDAAHRCVVLLAIILCAGLAASAARAVSGDPAGYIAAFASLRGLQLVLYARARKYLPRTRRLYGWYLMCFGTGGALWLCSLAVSGPARYAVWTAALAADAAGGLGMLAPSRYVPLNPGHLTERFQLFVLIVLGESVARLISAATLRPWSVPLATVLTAATVTLAAMWWAWVRSADQRALDRPQAIPWFAAVNLPTVAGIAAASAGLHIAVLAADGATTIGIGPRAALYGGVSVCLLATAIMPSGKLTKLARAIRLVTSAAAMGLVFMGAIVLPVYLVPALTVTLAVGLAAESLATFGAGAAGRQPVFWRPAAMPLTVRSSRRSSELASSGASSARSADSARS